MIEDLLVTLLRTALVPDVGTRVYHLAIPQNATFPACVYRKLVGQNLKILTAGVRLRKDQYQIDLYAVDTATITRMSRAVSAVEGASTLSDADRTVRWIWINEDSEDYVPPQQMDDKGVRVATVILTIWHD